MGTSKHIYTSASGTTITALLSARAHSYLVENSGKFALIDTGAKFQQKQLLQQLDEIPGTRNGLEYLILTHTHFDHAYSAGIIQGKYNAKVIVQRAETYWLQNGYGHLPRSKYWLIDHFTRLGHRKVPQWFSYPPVKADHLIDEDESFSLGQAQLTCIPTPGHSQGSMSIMVNNDSVIAGDTLVHIKKSHIFPAFADDKALVLEQWKKYLQLPAQIFYPAHGKPVSKVLIQKNLPKYLRKYGV